jgi:hypothetical protein
MKAPKAKSYQFNHKWSNSIFLGIIVTAGDAFWGFREGLPEAPQVQRLFNQDHSSSCSGGLQPPGSLGLTLGSKHLCEDG